MNQQATRSRRDSVFRIQHLDRLPLRIDHGENTAMVKEIPQPVPIDANVNRRTCLKLSLACAWMVHPEEKRYEALAIPTLHSRSRNSDQSSLRLARDR